MSFFKRERAPFGPGAAVSTSSTAKRFLITPDRLRGIALILVGLAVVGPSASGVTAKSSKPPAAPDAMQPTIWRMGTRDGFHGHLTTANISSGSQFAKRRYQ